jgi:hypothetical protein
MWVSMRALRWPGVPWGDDLGEALAQGGDGVRAGRGRRGLGEVGEFVAAQGELVEAGGQVTEALAAGAFVEAAVLERGQVTVDRATGCRGLPGDGGQNSGVQVAGVDARTAAPGGA